MTNGIPMTSPAIVAWIAGLEGRPKLESSGPRRPSACSYVLKDPITESERPPKRFTRRKSRVGRRERVPHSLARGTVLLLATAKRACNQQVGKRARLERL